MYFDLPSDWSVEHFSYDQSLANTCRLLCFKGVIGQRILMKPLKLHKHSLVPTLRSMVALTKITLFLEIVFQPTSKAVAERKEVFIFCNQQKQ